MSSSPTHFQLSPIKAMELAAAKIPGSISLAQGIPSFETPQVIRNFIKEKMDLGLCDKYSLTNGLAELREEISFSLAADGLSYDPESEIVVTAGSIEGITASVLAATEPGDEVLIPSPTYASYLGSLAIARAVPKFVHLDEDNNFDFRIDAFKEALTSKVKAILYCSPNNPTGTLYSEDKTRALIELALERNITVIIDEVYKDFYYTDDVHFSPVAIPAARQNVIRVCSFSKAYAMTGWRVGFVHADASRTQKILKYHDAMVSCAPVVSQFGAIAALRFGAPFLESFKKEFRRRRNLSIEWLDRMSNIIDYQTPKATYFVFPRIKDIVPLARDSHALAYDILAKVGVATVPGVAFGPAGESHLRITYGKEVPVLEEAFSRIDEYFRGRQSHKRNLNLMASSEKHVPDFKTSIRAAARSFLSLASRIYLARVKPTIIGIAGTKGKTVVKRMVAEKLSASHRTRSSILSYNTEIGLPLSILNLTPPNSLLEFLLFPFQVLGRALLGRRDTDVLVLEYGIVRASDGELLRKIAIPDWLVITDLGGADPLIDVPEITKGISTLSAGLPAARIISFAEKDEKNYMAALEQLVSSGQVSIDGRDYSPERETVGRSSKVGFVASILLSKRIALAVNLGSE